ncbi:MAG TPA: 1-acyl-sn-glycerol-3-phosphate acyltransferase [Acidimicrobiia bacterium]|nr:1-acyl-sn-glycerol-3-phosphate acyltransferase [Acidimicrobiia bacterium]
MIDNTISRRLITIPVVVVMFLLVSVGLPFLIATGLLVDLARAGLSGRPAMASRLIVFLWLYLLGEMLALLALAFAGLHSHDRAVDLTYRFQAVWAAWNLNAIEQVFGLTFVAEGLDQVPPPPILLLARHASLIDTMLPARYVARDHGIMLRYVLKKQLLIDPALDIGGNRLPNHFVDRGSGDTESEIASIRALGAGMSDAEGILIYPEGTRYSEEKRVRYVGSLLRKGGPLAEIAAGFERVLPPRSGGTLALLDATTADVVVLAHRGLEGLATVKDIWSGELIGSRIDVKLWRVSRAGIPRDRSARVEWLYRLWGDVDHWVSERRRVG